MGMHSLLALQQTVIIGERSSNKKKDKLRSTAIIDIGFGGATNNEMETERGFGQREYGQREKSNNQWINIDKI